MLWVYTDPKDPNMVKYAPHFFEWLPWAHAGGRWQFRGQLYPGGGGNVDVEGLRGEFMM